MVVVATDVVVNTFVGDVDVTGGGGHHRRHCQHICR